jgi:hypothetical protein
MIGIAALGGLIAVLAIAIKAKADADDASSMPKKYIDEMTPKTRSGLSEDVKKVIIRHAKGYNPPTKTELEIASSSASMAGYDKLGDELANQAKKAPDVAPPKTVMPSPLDGVDDIAWTKFVKKMGTGRLDSVTPKGIGSFQISVRRLTDFGILKDPKKENGTWTADWIVPKDKLLTTPRLQYKIFERSMVNYARNIKDKYPDQIGKTFEGTPATLSGLLAVAHVAGASALGQWIGDTAQRAKFKHTSAAYTSANGIF